MIGSAVGDLIGNIAILAGAAGKGGLDEFKKIKDLWKKLQTPEYDMATLQSPEMQVFMQQHPELYSAIVPQSVATAQDSPEMRAAQMQGIAQVQQMAQQGLPYGQQAAIAEGQRALAQAHRGNTQSILSNYAQRGRAGAGDELAARTLAGLGEAELARGFGSDAGQLKANQMAQASYALPGMAGAARAQDYSQSLTNAQLINRFNELVANTQNMAAQYGAGARERAQGYNVGTAQRVGEGNVMNRYANQIRNQEYPNQMRNQAYLDQLAKLQGLSGARSALGQAKYDEQAQRAQNIRSTASSVGGIADIGLSFI